MRIDSDYLHSLLGKMLDRRSLTFCFLDFIPDINLDKLSGEEKNKLLLLSDTGKDNLLNLSDKEKNESCLLSNEEKHRNFFTEAAQQEEVFKTNNEHHRLLDIENSELLELPDKEKHKHLLSLDKEKHKIILLSDKEKAKGIFHIERLEETHLIEWTLEKVGIRQARYPRCHHLYWTVPFRLTPAGHDFAVLRKKSILEKIKSGWRDKGLSAVIKVVIVAALAFVSKIIDKMLT